MASIYLRGNIWWVSYYESGRLIQKSLKTRDPKVAKYKRNEFENKLSIGDSPLPTKNALINEAILEYSEDSRHRKTPKTIADDQSRLKSFSTTMGLTFVNQITEQGLSTFIQNKLDSEKINHTTANHIIKTVKAFLSFCIRKRLIHSSPLAYMKKYKVERKPPRYLSKKEIENILDSIRKHELYPLVMVALYTGMRYGEIINIKWKDIDLENNTITVPKSKSGRFRVIPIHDRLKPLLTKNTIPFKMMVNYRALRSLQAATGRKDIGWHTFRHTFASHLVMNGVDIVTVSKLLGHSRIETTVIYSHLSDGHVRDSIDKLKI
ncbi:MAG TPA: site-specific integrase [Candidatus Obscuribacterales bacterium]